RQAQQPSGRRRRRQRRHGHHTGLVYLLGFGLAHGRAPWRTSTTGPADPCTCRSRRPRGATSRCHQGDSVDLSPLMWSTQGMKTEATEEIFALFQSLYMLIIYMIVGRMLFSHLYSC
ncbi:unnamed protein product, partial [Heterosigma akashiwo]